MSSLSLQSFPSCSTNGFVTLVPSTLKPPTTNNVSLKIQQLPVKSHINQLKKEKPLRPGTCTVIGCHTKESSQWYRNKEALDQTAKMCHSCYQKACYKNSAEKTQSRSKTFLEKKAEKTWDSYIALYEKIKAAQKRQQEVKNLINQSLPGTCTIIGCTKTESRRWHRNPEALEETAKMCESCYRRAQYKKNPEKAKASSRAWRKKNPEKAKASYKASNEKAKAAKNRQQTSYAIQSEHNTGNVEICKRDWIDVAEVLSSEDDNSFNLDVFSDSDPFDFIQEVTSPALDFLPS